MNRNYRRSGNSQPKKKSPAFSGISDDISIESAPLFAEEKSAPTGVAEPLGWT
jgi:hypothetical protein